MHIAECFSFTEIDNFLSMGNFLSRKSTKRLRISKSQVMGIGNLSKWGWYLRISELYIPQFFLKCENRNCYAHVKKLTVNPIFLSPTSSCARQGRKKEPGIEVEYPRGAQISNGFSYGTSQLSPPPFLIKRTFSSPKHFKTIKLMRGTHARSNVLSNHCSLLT